MTSDLDATTPKGLRNRYAICGVGETPYMRGSKYSTRSLATWAVKNAMDWSFPRLWPLSPHI